MKEQWLNKNAKPYTVSLLKGEDFSLKFYADSKIIATDTFLHSSIATTLHSYYFTRKKILDCLVAAGLPVTELQSFPDFHISKVNAQFLYAQSCGSQWDTTVVFTLKK